MVRNRLVVPLHGKFKATVPPFPLATSCNELSWIFQKISYIYIYIYMYCVRPHNKETIHGIAILLVRETPTRNVVLLAWIRLPFLCPWERRHIWLPQTGCCCHMRTREGRKRHEHHPFWNEKKTTCMRQKHTNLPATKHTNIYQQKKSHSSLSLSLFHTATMLQLLLLRLETRRNLCVPALDQKIYEYIPWQSDSPPPFHGSDVFHWCDRSSSILVLVHRCTSIIGG
jgi:hypothetical protein